jgi:hypothetical protein
MVTRKLINFKTQKLIPYVSETSWHDCSVNSVYDFDGKTWFVAHGYDKHDNGRSKLIVKEITWDRAEWPVLVFDKVETGEVKPDDVIQTKE